jgi:hypothetical protein
MESPRRGDSVGGFSIGRKRMALPLSIDKAEAIFLQHNHRVEIYRISDGEFSMIMSAVQYNAYTEGGMLERVFRIRKEIEYGRIQGISEPDSGENP